MEKKFIYCTDEGAAEQLLSYYKLISKSQDGTYIFENKPKKAAFDFSNIKGKVAFSNILIF